MTTQELKIRHAFENIRNNYVGWQDNDNFKVLEQALAALATVSDAQPVVPDDATYGKNGPIDANRLEEIAKERPDECFLKGSGVLKLIGAIRQLEREARRAASSVQAVPNGWRCFHCGESFTDAEQAALHFGPTQHHEPGCQVSVEQLRELERDLERYREEDADLHRQIYGMQAQHHTALQREEEKGYARGLADAAALSTPSVHDSDCATKG